MQTKSSAASSTDDDLSSARSKLGARIIPSFSPSGEIGEQFTTWLTGSGGGCKKDRPAQQIVSRCLKFIKFCCEEEEELSFDVMDFSLCSPSLLFKLIDCLQEECKLVHGGRLGCIRDFRVDRLRCLHLYSFESYDCLFTLQINYPMTKFDQYFPVQACHVFSIYIILAYVQIVVDLRYTLRVFVQLYFQLFGCFSQTLLRIL